MVVDRALERAQFVVCHSAVVNPAERAVVLENSLVTTLFTAIPEIRTNKEKASVIER